MPEPPPGLEVGAIPREPPGFQPRPDLLAELDRAGAQGPAPGSVTGVPGTGTTQLAAAYARARLAQGWRLVAWVSAASPGTLAGGLAEVADAAGLSGGSIGNDPGDRGHLVRRWLEADGDRCLLVFDDVAEPETVRPYLPAGGAARVIVTSRQAPGLGTHVPVGAFSAGEALAFLSGRAGLTEAAAGAVAAELGHLPLALAQAAAVITGRRLDHGTYLEQLRAVPPSGQLAQEGEYPPGTVQAVLLSLDAAQAADPAGVCSGAMDLISVLSLAGVRRDLLHAAGQRGALGGRRVAAAQVDAALEQAARWSLLTFSLDGQVVLVNRLVTQMIRDRLARWHRLAAVCRGVASVLEARAEELAGSPDRPAVRDVPEQVTVLAAAAGPATGTDEALTRLLLRLRFLALYHLIELGDSAEQAITAGETLTAQNNLAAGYQEAGRVGEARLLFELTPAARERLLGPSHPSTLISLGNLAAAYRDEGRADDALRLFEQTLKGREAVLGADHQDTITARVNLAAAYRQAGRVTEAIPLVERILATRERLLGPNHPGTLTARNNLAAAYREVGRVTEAIPLFERTVADCERLLGADHPRTLRARKSLARAREAAADGTQD